jgi:pilus assembly protein Flp/PilA
MYRHLVKSVRKFLRDESGPTAVEYAVLVALVILLCVASIELLGISTGDSFGDSAEKIQSATGS